MSSQSSDGAVLSASYSSPSGEKIFIQAIQSPNPATRQTVDAHAKTAYLSELRSSTRRLQNDINVFLTHKMEEDKAQNGAATTQNGRGVHPKDDEEEENYGEERVEDDE